MSQASGSVEGSVESVEAASSSVTSPELPGGSNVEWFERAARVIPGGVDSPVRSFKAVGGTPFTVARGEGAFVFDVEGRSYVDMVQSYGAVILGHAHPLVVEAVSMAASLGTTFGAPTPGEVLLAEAICSRVAGLDQVRLVSSGTEATMSAIRVARGYTERDRVVVFEGCYHGHADSLLAAGGSGVATLGMPSSAGVPAGAVADTMVVPYGEMPHLDERVACVVVEPVAANMGVVVPPPGFLEALRSGCDEVGALLVFDEVITGFRVANGAASGILGVQPDLWCFGKVIGGGLPIGAFGGRREVLSVLAPDGPVYQAGTLSGNPAATAAGLAVLRALGSPGVQGEGDQREGPSMAQGARRASGNASGDSDGRATPIGPLDALATRVDSFARSLASVLESQGLAVQVPTFGPLVSLFFADSPVRNFSDASRAASNRLYGAFFHEMLERGIALAPGPYEAMFPGLAHSEDVLGRVLEAAAAAGKALQGRRHEIGSASGGVP